MQLRQPAVCVVLMCTARITTSRISPSSLVVCILTQGYFKLLPLWNVDRRAHAHYDSLQLAPLHSLTALKMTRHRQPTYHLELQPRYMWHACHNHATQTVCSFVIWTLVSVHMSNGSGSGGALPLPGQPRLCHLLTPDETTIALVCLAIWRSVAISPEGDTKHRVCRHVSRAGCLLLRKRSDCYSSMVFFFVSSVLWKTKTPTRWTDNQEER